MKKSMLIVLMAGVTLLSACKGNNSGYESTELRKESADSTTAAGNATGIDESKQKLVKTAEMQFKVKDVLKSSETISSLVNEYNGMVMNHHLVTTVNDTQQMHKSADSLLQVSAFTITDEMVVRVPQQQLVSFMVQVSHLSMQVNVMKMDIDDRTIDYLLARLKARNRSEVEAYQQKERPTTTSAAALLALKDDKVDKEVNNIKTDAEIKYSTVNLRFTQNPGVSKQVVANTDLSAYNLPVSSRLLMALAYGWEVFTDLIIGLANIWVFLLLALAGWAGFKYYKKRQHKELLSNI